ncbi:hypothetical protein GCM10010230_40330 [Streptomyces narbonensis]|nr:hypothetical protein GCM10010230_40330 [Streptomyces narbonensis]
MDARMDARVGARVGGPTAAGSVGEAGAELVDRRQMACRGHEASKAAGTDSWRRVRRARRVPGPYGPGAALAAPGPIEYHPPKRCTSWEDTLWGG